MRTIVATSDRDFEELDTLVAEYEEALPPDLRHSDFEAVRARLRERFQPPNAALLAMDGTVAAGCVLLTGLDRTTAVVTKMFVRPAGRGRGTARALMEALIGAARIGGFSRIVLDTDREQLNAAYRLYASLGFTECAPYGPVEYANPTYMEMSI